MPLEYVYSEKEMLNEFKKIKNNKGDYSRNPDTNKIVLTYQPHYYLYENYLYKTNPTLRRQLIVNRMKYLNKEEWQLTDRDLLRGFKISGIHIGYSHFSPYWIKAFIEEYNIKSIYDFCGGWGHRLLGAMDIDYIYNDINKNTWNGVKNIFDDFDFSNREKIFYNEDCSKFIPDEFYESVFTCPPYYNTEIYNEINYPDYVKWLNEWWYNSVDNTLQHCKKYFCFIINNKYKDDMKSICLKLKLKFDREIKIGKNILNHFQRKSKNIKKGENLIIFHK